MTRLYLISFPHQRAQIDAWCWGSCGHGLVGAIELPNGTACVPCDRADCPHLEKEVELGTADDDPETVYVLRKLAGVVP